MPMGPIELADTVGLDICLHVGEMLKADLVRPMPDLSPLQRKKVEAGELGRKTGKGFYEWKDGNPVKDRDAPKPTEEMADRLILPMLDACVACLREGVVADEDTIDGAMIFATGFPPFRGGPMHYIRSRGVADVYAALKRLAERYGERFNPSPGWDRLAGLASKRERCHLLGQLAWLEHALLNWNQVDRQTRSAPSPLVGEGWGGG